jgi:hypothetical protein
MSEPGMRFLFLDETNLVASQGDFFIYGGLVITPEQMPVLHDAVSQIRATFKFQPTDSLKFHTRSRPDHLSIADWTLAKSQVIAAAEAAGVRLLSYVVLHDIAKQQTQETLLEWALNAIVSHFDLKYLAEHSDRGAVCLDRLDEKFSYAYFQDKFSNGVTLHDGRTVLLSRIVYYSTTCDGASHLSSIVDIVLGGLRYCVNSASGTGNDAVAAQIFPPVARMMWSKDSANERKIGGYGFLQYPREVRVPAYQERYRALATALSSYSR